MQPEHFFQVLYAGYDDYRLRFEIRRKANTEDGAKWYSSHFPLTDEGYKKGGNAAYAMSHTADVYMGVLPRIGPSRDMTGVRYATHLWVEVDAGQKEYGDALNFLDAAIYDERIFQPSMIVASGGGVHAYFKLKKYIRLNTDEDRSTFSMTLKRLCMAIGNVRWDRWTLKPDDATSPFPDPKSTDPARILRVPGTINHKPNRNCGVSVIQVNPDAPSLSYDQWQTFLPEPPATAIPRQYVMEIQGDDLAPKVRAAMVTIWPEGERHGQLLKILYHARKRGKDYNGLLDIAETFKSRQANWKDDIIPMVRDTMRRVTVGP